MNAIKIRTTFESPPQSFSELNQRLCACLICQNFKPLHLSKTIDKVSLELVLKAVRFPLHSYTDVTEEEIQSFWKFMVLLFPTKTAPEEQMLKIFLKNIPAYAQPTLKRDPRTSVGYITGNSNSVPRNQEGVSLKEYETRLTIDPKQRLNQILIANAGNNGELDSQEKAEVYQKMLNLLLAEQMIMLASLKKGIAKMGAIHFRKLSQEGLKAIDYSYNTTMTFPDYKSSLNQSELSATLQVRSSKETANELIVQLTNGMNPKLAIDLKKIIAKLKELNEFSKTQQAEWGKSIETQLNGIRAQLLVEDTLSIKNELIAAQTTAFLGNSRLLKLSDSIAEQGRLSDQFSKEFPNCIPFTDWILRKNYLMKAICSSGTLNTLLDDSIELKLYGKHLPLYSVASVDGDEEEIQQFCKKWLELQPHQSQLYQLTYQELDSIIKQQCAKTKDVSKKGEWMSYKKMLFGKDPLLPATLPIVKVPTFEELTPTYQSFFGPLKEETPVEDSKPVVSKKETQKQKKPLPKQKSAPTRNNSSSSSSRPTEASCSTQDLLDLPQVNTESDDEPVAITKAVPLTPTIDPETLGSPPPFTLEHRTQRWLDHPIGKPLTTPPFEADYVNKGLDYQKQMIEAHGLTHLIDRHCDIGNRITYKGNIQYLVTAEIQKDGEQEVKRGVINWTIGAHDNKCYHRFFHVKKDREIIKLMMEQTFFEESDFPSLSEAMLIAPLKSKNVQRAEIKRDPIHIDNMFGNVTIYDPRLQLTVTLFRSTLYLNSSK